MGRITRLIILVFTIRRITLVTVFIMIINEITWDVHHATTANSHVESRSHILDVNSRKETAVRIWMATVL